MAAASSAPEGILHGIRVLELADWIAGPFATSILGDFGAEVIRIDLPGKVVNTRTLYGLEEADPERSPFFAVFAHDKKSVTLDVRSEQGREVFLDLVRRSDVVVEGFRPGTLERWGIGWEALREINPRLIMLRISGYGQTGPWSQRPGLDRVAQAFGGATFVTGHPDGPPVRCGLGFADYSTGMWGAMGVLLALFEQRAKGSDEGQVIDQALYESILPMLCEMPLLYQRYGEIVERNGNRVHGIAPGDAFRTSDDAWVQISASGDVAWERLAKAMGQPELVDDPRFETTHKRDEHNDVLLPIVASWVAELTAEEVVEKLDEVGVAASRIQTIAEVVSHPQVQARGDFVQLEDPVFGSLPAYAPLPRLSRTPGRIERTGPRLGEHNDDVYRQLLGLDDQRLEQLAAAGAI